MTRGAGGPLLSIERRTSQATGSSLGALAFLPLVSSSTCTSKALRARPDQRGFFLAVWFDPLCFGTDAIRARHCAPIVRENGSG